MAERERDRKSSDPKAEQGKRRATPLQLWLEEAWEGWIKQVGLMVVCALLYLLYKFDLLPEQLAGVLAVCGILLGAALSTAPPAWQWLGGKPAWARALFVTFMALWLVSTGYPALRAALPPKPIAEGRLTAAQLTTRFDTGTRGPYELTVSGRFKQAGMADAEASYTVLAEGGGRDEVSGLLKRSLVRTRAGRRGGVSTSLQEHTENAHRLPHVVAAQVTLSTPEIDEQLDGGLTVLLRPARIEPMLFWIMSGVALLLAVGFDARLADPRGKIKGYLAAAVGTSGVFAFVFPGEATAHSLVRPAVSALILAGLFGGLGGWLLGAVARMLWGTQPKKVKR